MYLKLALRNAKRSMLDYLLYIVSMIMLTSVICFTNCIANWGDMQAGFQTIALPLLIVVIMVVLVNYINIFIVKQRAREFATYMLLGMEKDKLSLVFLCELLVIGLICFLFGATLGLGIFAICCCTILQGAGEQSIFQIILKSIIQTLVYFCGVEVLSILFMKRKIYKLQIVQLVSEKRRNQPLRADKKLFWGRAFVISFSCYAALLFGISFMSDELMAISISFISLPMLLCVFSFYKWLYAFISFLRLSQADALYQGNRLYRIAQMTTGSKTSANMNKLNLILPTFMCNLTIKAISGFMICFFALYLCYFCVIHMINTRYIKSNTK